jgi:hypothetical protein
MSGTLAPMTMNGDTALINAVYCQVQCLGCTHWRKSLKAAIGKFYLAKPGARESTATPLDQLLRKYHVPDRAGALQDDAINVVTA